MDIDSSPQRASPGASSSPLVGAPSPIAGISTLPPQIITLTPSTRADALAAGGGSAHSTPTGNPNGRYSSVAPTAEYFPLLHAYGSAVPPTPPKRARTGNTPEPGSVAGALWPQACDAPSAANPAKQYVWLIFGATGTVGRHICRSVLERGDLVMACSRNIKTTVSIPPEWKDRLFTTTCDVRSRASVKEVVERTVQRWNRIDVVMTCFGIGVISPCEQQEEHDVRAQFETNVVGLFHIVQTTLPYLRLRNRGRYIVFSSIAGMLGIPGIGPFSGTKWAAEGMMESLAYEIEEFGCKATLVYPGVVEQAESDKRSPPWRHFVIKPLSNDYRGTPAEHARRMILWLSAHRATGVAKIGEIVWELAHCKNPPLRLLMGSEAVETMRDKLRQTIEEVEDWKFLYTGDADD
ncbi:uncharacterized protein V1518DRAFT_377999 [Limtongia smithiae]|uniref:uncharacterized protein n=1 Tax=Limtongia smithiae TaxID=1125753 RepID=UPI0034CFAB04